MSSSVFYAGIDPGKSGAIVVINGAGEVVHAAAMKDLDEVLYVLRRCKTLDAYVWLEKVHAMPGQGVTSMFTFGEYFGIWWALRALKIPHEFVLPFKWMRTLGIPKKKKSESKPDFKRRLKEEAHRRFPDAKVTLQTADALLIACAVHRALVAKSYE